MLDIVWQKGCEMCLIFFFGIIRDNCIRNTVGLHATGLIDKTSGKTKFTLARVTGRFNLQCNECICRLLLHVPSTEIHQWRNVSTWKNRKLVYC